MRFYLVVIALLFCSRIGCLYCRFGDCVFGFLGFRLLVLVSIPCVMLCVLGLWAWCCLLLGCMVVLSVVPLFVV